MKTPQIFKTVEELHKIGFSLIWLKPKSKMPLENGWTKGPRKAVSELRKVYKPGMNLGVRLGSTSKIGDKFLAVIDCDVKSTDKKHEREMLQKLKTLGLGESVTVMSGRGNGSRHIHVVTDKPVTGGRVGQSSEKVKVHMPSVPPSSFELKTLTGGELEAGYRLRPAWEISLMGEGRQVVLPPSIHPDSGRAYAWQRTRPQGASSFERMVNVPAEASKPTTARLDGFKPVEVDLVGSNLSQQIMATILTGENCEDRSAALYLAAMALVREGFSDNEILSVLTEPGYYLGAVAYQHTESASRKRAAEWIHKYTLVKARRECDSSNDFDEVLDESELPEAEIMAQHAAAVAVTKDNWQLHLETGKNGGAPKNTAGNVVLIFENVFGKNCFTKDLFSNKRMHNFKAPWGATVGDVLTDETIMLIKLWIGKHYNFEPSNDRIFEAAYVIAFNNAFHPVRDYLENLEWDGVQRIDGWLKTYLSAVAPEPYLSAISRKVLCAMVARIYRPGCKFDHMLVLEGPLQGEGKSRSIDALASTAWAGRLNFRADHKDMVLLTMGRWVLEVSELAGLQQKAGEEVKAFISETTDQVRLPYGRLTEEFPRQCILVGTTNRPDYLSDPTGNRRFWPVLIDGKCDVEGLWRDRDQLLAEAKFVWEMGEPLYLEDDDTARMALSVQKERVEHDAWVDTMTEFFKRVKSENSELREKFGDGFKMGDLFANNGPLENEKMDRTNQRRARDCLMHMGYVYKTIRDERHREIVRTRWVKRGKK